MPDDNQPERTVGELGPTPRRYPADDNQPQIYEGYQGRRYVHESAYLAEKQARDVAEARRAQCERERAQWHREYKTAERANSEWRDRATAAEAQNTLPNGVSARYWAEFQTERAKAAEARYLAEKQARLEAEAESVRRTDLLNEALDRAEAAEATIERVREWAERDPDRRREALVLLNPTPDKAGRDR